MKKPLNFSSFRIEYAQQIWDKCHTIKGRHIDYTSIECYAHYLEICGHQTLSEEISILKHKTMRMIQGLPRAVNYFGERSVMIPTFLDNEEYDEEFSKNVTKEIDKLIKINFKNKT